MSFRYQDLMIDVVGETGECLHLSQIGRCRNATCQIFSGCGGASLCYLTDYGQATIYRVFQRCGVTVTPCGGSIVDPTALAEDNLVQFSARDLQQLRAQLRRALAHIDEREKAQEAASRPRTLAEAEELESKLKGALEELQRQKTELR